MNRPEESTHEDRFAQLIAAADRGAPDPDSAMLERLRQQSTEAFVQAHAATQTPQ